MNNLKSALLAAFSAFKPFSYQNDAPKARNDTDGKSSGKTRRGATHTQGKVFQSRRIFAVTPAQYRQQHLGRSK